MLLKRYNIQPIILANFVTLWGERGVSSLGKEINNKKGDPIGSPFFFVYHQVHS